MPSRARGQYWPCLFSFWALGLLPSRGQAQQPFHQQVDHYLRARLLPEEKVIEVYDSVVYTNRAPRSLDTFYLHLWPQAYSSSRTALARQLAEHGKTILKFQKSARGRMEFSRFDQDGRPVVYQQWKKNPDVVWWRLASPLEPGGKLSLVFQYRIFMPSADVSRMGVKGNDYFVTQWFPKPAVYDAEGWHPMPYLDLGEFYCEWGTYRVELDIPARFVVAASGIPHPEYLYQLELRTQRTDSSLRDTTGRRLVRYVAEKVHDFAWCASPDWWVEKTVYPDPVSGQEKTVFAFFKTQNATLWKGITEQGRRSLTWFAEYFGQPYPYSFYNIVDGSLAAGSGMEYPQMTIIGPVSNRKILEEVVHHEIGHTWFQGILANNERDHPWLDEGLNSYFDARYARDVYGKEERYLNIPSLFKNVDFRKTTEGVKTLEYLLWNTLVRVGVFQGPARYSSTQYSQLNYGLSVYQHTAFLFRYLEEVVGQSVLDSALRLYYQRHAFTHVRPADLRRALEDITGQDMSWFFEQLLKSNGAENYRLRPGELKWLPQSRQLEILLRYRRMPIPIPVYVGPEYAKPEKQFVLWPISRKSVRLLTDSLPFEPRNLTLGRPFILPDYNFRDNYFLLTPRGWKRKKDFVVFPLINFLNVKRPGLALWPVYGWNNNNKSMLGLLVHNYALPPDRLQYYLMPLFSFNPHSWAGSAGLEYRFYIKKDFWPVVLSLDGHRYAYAYTTRPLNYLKNSLGLQIPLTDPRRPWRATMHLRAEYYCVQWEQHLWHNVQSLHDRNRYFRTLAEWRVEHSTRWNPFRHSLFLEGISEHAAAHSMRQTGQAFKIFQEVKAVFYFMPKYRGLHVRFFQGGFPWVPDTRINVNYKLSAWPGIYDYTYSGIFWDRSATRGLLARQMMEADGGFRQFVNFQSFRYLAALNLRLDFPRPVPARFFVDLGYTSTAYPGYQGKATHHFWSAGFTCHLLDETVAVHFPLFYCRAIKQFLSLNNSHTWHQQIRFVVDFNRLNPRRILNGLKFLN
ncbi:MAG: M1 family metallopeptidase [Flavobacteriales bacterium]|nr:M1 family metallopeptidase [Flavobacteriales bacterium]MDW8410819.1 M1 family metallopeptidase [Flavobacteriales bacterium]